MIAGIVGTGIATAAASATQYSAARSAVQADPDTQLGADPTNQRIGWGIAGLGLATTVGGLVGAQLLGGGSRSALLAGAGVGVGLGALAGLALGGALADARHGIAPADAADHLLRAFDHDGSGTLERSTAANRDREDRMLEADTHHHVGLGRITELRRGNVTDLLAQADQDRNRIVTRDELVEIARAWDSDGNGRLTGDERSTLDLLRGYEAD